VQRPRAALDYHYTNVGPKRHQGHRTPAEGPPAEGPEGTRGIQEKPAGPEGKAGGRGDTERTGGNNGGSGERPVRPEGPNTAGQKVKAYGFILGVGTSIYLALF
jgi:hypothetical protein